MLLPNACQCGHAHGEDLHEVDAHQVCVDKYRTHLLFIMKVVPIQPAPSLAFQLWHPWRFFVMNPLPVLFAYVLANFVIVAVGGLFRVLLNVLTLPGLLLVLFIGVFLLIRRIVSLMAYPGQLSLVIREGEANFARLTKRRLQIFTEAAVELVAILDPTTSIQPMRLHFLQVYQNFTFAQETLLVPVMRSLEVLEQDGHIGSNGAKLLQSLRDISTIHAQLLATPCSQLCSASESTFESQRLQVFQSQDALKPVTLVEQPVLKRSITVDSAALLAEAATKLKSSSTAHPLVTSAVAVRRLQTAIALIGPPEIDSPVSRNILWLFKELCCGPRTSVDSIATLAMLRADLTVRFKAEQIWIPGYQNHPIDAMLMPPLQSDREGVHRPVVMLCNPNGGLYEVHHLQMDWIKFYTSELNCHVLVYNYRGYGRCKGSPCPQMNNLDGLAIVKYLKSERKMHRLAVHGESIGGLVATYLARHSSLVDVLIADRTFATLPALAQRMIAKWPGSIVDSIMRWDTDNVQNYQQATCAKLLCSDPCDDIILDGASLKTGVALNHELHDTRYALPSQRATNDSFPSSAVPINAMEKLRIRCDPRRMRRVSEAASLPHLGHALTETMTCRFSNAVLSIGRRALTSRRNKEDDAIQSVDEIIKNDPTTTIARPVVVTIQDGDDETGSGDENEQHAMLVAESSFRNESTAFSDELLAVIWMLLARLDGYCGQVLLQAAENGGHDKIRAWIVSLLTWGGHVAPERRGLRSLEPFDRNGIMILPLSVFDAREMLQRIVEQCPSIKFDYDIGFVVHMMNYLSDTLERRWRQVDSAKIKDPKAALRDEKLIDQAMSMVIDTGDTKLGALLPLHCGHNKNYDENEKQALVGFLKHVGFLDC
ncbi:hypothetical protein CCR75_004646 [Bremia lactucae]|uniref:AB hydrolase-1 domain-containing protein n=1 Tax=Bremia lactucae TaxID=4779 RepID=A0A976FRP5_BRELC|nr:hypothetical protein CCR75_004646 [Bremia lactucae]